MRGFVELFDPKPSRSIDGHDAGETFVHSRDAISSKEKTG